MTRRDDLDEPKPEHKFSFGLWTVGNRDREPFGDFVRSAISPVEIAYMLAEVGAWGVNLHDNASGTGLERWLMQPVSYRGSVVAHSTPLCAPQAGHRNRHRLG
jgi:hypothetical protein